MLLPIIKFAQQSAPSTLPPIEEVVSGAVQTIDTSFEYGFVNTLIFAAIVAILTFVILKTWTRFAKKRFTGNSKIFYRLIYVAIILIAVIVVLLTIKPLRDIGTAILASSGIAAVVIGLAAQGTLSNVFSGISISMSKPFSVGEFIEILNATPPVSGVVEGIGLRHTTIRDPENKTIVIPNNVLDQEMLRTTHYLQGARICSFLYIDIAYNSDIDLAINMLSTIVSEHKNTLDVRSYDQKEEGVPKVAVFVTGLSNAAVHLRASVWTVDTATGFTTLSDLRYQVKKAFDAAGIEIPYPYQNIILHKDAEPPVHGKNT